MRISTRYTIALGVCVATVVAAASFIGGAWWSRSGQSKDLTPSSHRILYYHDPMHPSYKSDKPGIAPDCGMQLEPVYADAAGMTKEPTGALPPGAVQISVERQQLMGLRTMQAMRSSGAYTLRVVGKVVADETRLHRVATQADGTVRMVSAYAGGEIVHKDDVLASYFVYTREVYNAMQSYFLAMNGRQLAIAANTDPAVMDSAQAEVRLSEEMLQTYGVSSAQLRDLALSRKLTRDIELRAPATGLVVARNAFLGQRAERGTELFRIADISRVWVLADLFEGDSGLIRPGAAAVVKYRGRKYNASVADAQLFDPASRTLKVRLQLDNPGMLLRPEMFVDVEFDVKAPAGISVPVDAVLDSGETKAVFVSSGEGLFEPREVVTGTRYGNRVQITKGLQEQEAVVVSGLFLLDSESRLQLAAAGGSTHPTAQSKLAPGNTDPVCGMAIDASTAANKSDYQGTSYAFCSKECKAKFDRNPSSYIKQNLPAPGGKS